MAEPASRREGPAKTGVEGIIDALADLLQTAADWLRGEAASIVRNQVVLPIQRLGLTLASAGAAGCLIAFGMMFIAVAAFLLLAQWLTYPGALLLIGGVYVVAGVVFVAIKARLMQQ